MQQRQRLIVQSLDEADPLSGLLKTGTTHSPLSRKGTSVSLFLHF